jgi:membrane fusion protein, copper/silver efflux system
MKKTMNVPGSLFVGVVIGAVITVAGYFMWDDFSAPSQGNDVASTEKKPLYWVAPMNPNYKRDKPGKSPMGMDLIPVYEEGGAGEDSGPGTIKISPEVLNNLGVRTVLAERKPLHFQIQTVGYIEYDEDQLVHVHPRVEGWVEKLYVKASGDPVKKGQPLYEIYSPELVNAQEELLLALQRNTPRLIRAAKNRLKALQVPQTAIDQLDKTKKVKQTVTFYAPQGGVVDNLNIREGVFVMPGSTIMSIGTLKHVWVDAEIFERQAAAVAVGLPVTMTLGYLPGKEWLGDVDYVYPALDVKTRTLRVRLRFKNENEFLKPGMYAQVIIHAKNSDDRLVVPKEALIRTGSVNRVVLALDEGRFKSINVKVGRFDGQSAEILSGLAEGDRVVSSAQFLIDSESSKTSDFKRMSHADHDVPDSVWVEASINSLMAGHRMLNVSHQAISEWGWPEMSMDFIVADSVDFSSLEQGMTLHAEITKTDDDQYQITNVHIRVEKADAEDVNHEDMSPDGAEPEPLNLSTNDADMKEMDHSAHQGMNHEDMSPDGAEPEPINLSTNDADMKKMDHSAHQGMNHEEMDNSQQDNMNHDAMDHGDYKE